MMNVQEYVATQTERMAEGLAHFIATMPEDKLDWKPEIVGCAATRSVLQQISECIGVNLRMAKLIRHEDAGDGGFSDIPFADGQDAQKQLIASASVLASAIRGMSEGDFEGVFEHPRGQILGKNLILMSFRNMAYHAGQINFYQILCGDAEFHAPANWR